MVGYMVKSTYSSMGPEFGSGSQQPVSLAAGDLMPCYDL